MKNKFKYLSLIIFTTFLTSCDPVHNINLINNSNSNIKIKFNINPKTENYYLNKSASGDSIVFNLKPRDTSNIYFGIGTWSDNEIEETVNSIKSFEIETKDLKTIYKTEKSIKEFFKENREGLLFETSINIEIKN